MRSRWQVLLAIFCLGSVARVSAAPARQLLRSHLRSAVAQRQARSLGALPSTEQMHVSLVLPLRNHAGLVDFLSRVYDPSSTDYRHYLSVAQFTEQFGPSEADYQAVVNFAKSQGLTVTATPSNRLVVPVRGTVAQIQRAFNVQMNLYQHPTETRTFYSPDREPSVPAGLTVAHIAGLNNFSLPRAAVVRPHADAVSGQAAVQGSGPGGSYLGSDMRSAYYGGTALTGTGQTVALVEFDGYNQSDVDLTFSNAGQTYNVPIQNVLIDGALASPQLGDDGEQVLDIVQAIGMAPGLSQVRVYIGNPKMGGQDADILNSIASENLAQTVSISWSWSPDDPETDDVFFLEMAAQGQSVFAASGDYGAYSPQVAYYYPAEDAYVTAVGGTTLTTSGAGGGWASEIAWHQSGGGVSPDQIPIPAWQLGVATSSNGGSNTYRNVPDVAMEADFDNYACDLGKCQGTWAGTSFAAPRWAGFVALMNQQAAQAGNPPVGFLNPMVYQVGAGTSASTVLHDVTTGQNAYMGGSQASDFAGPGYDLVTGWGSPAGAGFISAMIPVSGPSFRLSATPNQLTIDPGSSGTTTIAITAVGGFSDSVSLGVSGLPGGVSGSFATNPATGSSVLTLTASSSAERGSYLLRVTGTSGNLTSTTSVSLLVDAPGFSMAPSSPNLAIPQGSVGSETLTTTSYAGFAGAVQYAVTSALPAGVTALLYPDPSSGKQVVSFLVSRTAQTGGSMVTVTGTAGSLTASTTFALQVTRPIFYLALTSIPFYLAEGTSATATASVVAWGAYPFGNSISLKSSLMPSGETVQFQPASLTSSTSSEVTFTAGNAMVPGTSMVGIQANDAGGASYSEFNQFIRATPTPSFTVGVSPAVIAMQQGGSATAHVTVGASYGFTDSVNLSVTQTPAGMSSSFDQNPTPTHSVLTLTASSTTPPGFYDTSVWAAKTDNTLSALSGLFVEVDPSLHFSLAVAPASLTLAGGVMGTATAVITPQNGFAGTTEITVSGLPPGMTYAVTSGPTADASVITVSPNGITPGNDFYLNIVATGGSQTLVATIPVATKLTTKTLLTIPTGSSMLAGQSYTLAANVVDQNGTAATGVVAFTVGMEGHTVNLDANGRALYTGTAPQQIGPLSISASYLGNGKDEPSTAYPASAMVQPLLTALSPANAHAGSSGFPLTLNGVGFTSACVVYWGTTALTTQFVSPSELTAQVPASDVASAGAVRVTVQVPSLSATSNLLQFEVDSSSAGVTPPVISPAAITVPGGSSANVGVSLFGSPTNVTVNCLNLPAGALCNFSSASNTLTISTAASTPKGSYQITVVFSETLAGTSSAVLLAPFLLLPLRGKRRGIGRMIPMVVLGLLLAMGAVCACGGGGNGTTASTGTTGSGGGSSPSSPPATSNQQVTSSATVSLTVQ